nr:sulfatase-like hydrolase/transferase [Candidatus Sigynarchaeota archaeon]
MGTRSDDNAGLPHIIIFNPDQWRGDVLGHAGNAAAITPTLDRLAASEAASFTSTYCQNPVCTPSRCSFMTGWYPHTRGHRTMHHMLHPERGEPNLLKILKDSGYFVFWAGKNDLVPGQHGSKAYCNVYYVPLRKMLKNLKLVKQRSLHLGGDWRGPPDGDNYYSFFAGKLDVAGEAARADYDVMMVEGAAEFIEKYRGGKPLCMYLPLSSPHPPYGIEEPWFSMIDRAKIPPRIPSPRDWDTKPSILKGIADRQRLQGWSEDRWRELQATYYAMCARTDDQLNTLVSALKKRGFYDNAWLFFFSDHGDFTGDYGLVEKTQNTFEDCLIHVPFLVKPPKAFPLKKPGINNALVELVDFPATIYEITGIKPRYTYFGKSLLPLLRGERDANRDAVFCEGWRLYGEEQTMEKQSLRRDPTADMYYPRISLQTTDAGPYHTKAAACRTRHYKYTLRLYERSEFYDLAEDPTELHNAIDDPRYAQVIQDLKDKMLRWYMETADEVPWDEDSRHVLNIPFGQRVIQRIERGNAKKTRK